MYSTVRQWLHRQLEPEAWGSGLSPVNRFIAMLIVLAAVIAILETAVTVRAHSPAFFLYAEVLIIAILPFILTMGGVNLVVVRLLKFLRLFRLVRLGVCSLAWSVMETAVSRRKYELILSLGVAGGLLILSASLIYLAEASVQLEEFGSIPRTLWWAIATLTTVGYGDVTPVTALGRFLAGNSAVAGIGLVAMPAGILAAAFIDAFQSSPTNGTGSEERGS